MGTLPFSSAVMYFLPFIGCIGRSVLLEIWCPNNKSWRVIGYTWIRYCAAASQGPKRRWERVARRAHPSHFLKDTSENTRWKAPTSFNVLHCEELCRSGRCRFTRTYVGNVMNRRKKPAGTVRPWVQKIEELCLRKGWSHQDLARETGLVPSTITNMALVGFQGRRVDEGTPADSCHSLFLETLIFQES
jgi:hypothetical protein